MTSNTDPDRLSNLPDAILITILSFLKPREAVQTCVLSKKWRNLWTFIPCLAFKCDDFVQDRNPIEKRYSNYNLNREDLERFQNFVSMFLRLRDNSTAVQFFRLHHTKLACNPEISGLNEMWAGLSNMWIRYALKHNVKKIVLRGHECFNLLDRLFTCESLEDLCMDLVFGCFNNDLVFIMPNIIFLPKLKNLHIENVNMGGNCVKRLISGCSNLESLSLSCNVMMQNNISLHFLKQLYLDRCSFLPSMFYISAPCVEYLYIWGHLECGTKLEDISRVKKAKIHFHKEMDFELYNCEVVSSLLGVENLHMEAYGVLKEVLEGELPNCRTFHNLKKLTLERGCMHCDFGLVSTFIMCCTNLEILTFFHDEHTCENPDHTEKEPDVNLGEIQKFGCDRLRLIEIVYMEGEFYLDWVIRRLLRSTIGINNVQIVLKKSTLRDMDAHFNLDDMHRHDRSCFDWM